jgi:hypothetical protein
MDQGGTPDAGEDRARAALGALGVEIPAELIAARSGDPGVRAAALWALLWRTAGEGMDAVVFHTPDLRTYADRSAAVMPQTWPLPQDNDRWSRTDLAVAFDRLAAILPQVPAGGLAVVGDRHEGARPVDGYVLAALSCVQAAQELLQARDLQGGPRAVEAGAAATGRLSAALDLSRRLGEIATAADQASETAG